MYMLLDGRTNSASQHTDACYSLHAKRFTLRHECCFQIRYNGIQIWFNIWPYRLFIENQKKKTVINRCSLYKIYLGDIAHGDESNGPLLRFAFQHHEEECHTGVQVVMYKVVRRKLCQARKQQNDGLLYKPINLGVSTN